MQCPIFKALFVSLLAAPLLAHDFWIEPQSFAPATNSVVTLRFRFGEDFVGEAFARDDEIIREFALVGPPGWQRVAGETDDDPAGRARTGGPGLYLAGYSSEPTFVEIPAAAFEEYLVKEGLEHAVKTRHANGTRNQPGREYYSRCAKTLLAVGSGATNGFAKPLGFRLEILPEKNPLTLAAGDTLPVRVLFDSKPCPDLYVVAYGTNAPRKWIAARTDAEGRVALKLPSRTTWMLKTTHIFPYADPMKADWESIWATYLFDQK